MYIPNDAVLTDRRNLMALASHPRRIRQILHLVQVEVVRQRCSAVTLPDTVMSEIIWGESSLWPKRWRRDLKTLISKLPKELIEHAEWRPVYVIDRKGDREVRRRQNKCPDRCPLHGSDIPHCHLVVFATQRLTGALEHHRIGELPILDRPSRKYNFGTTSDSEIVAEIKNTWKEGRFIYGHGPAMVFGPAAWSGLTATDLDVWQAIYGELTRHARSSRPDRARVFTTQSCPLLPNSPYVVFAGNFKTQKEAGGAGYRLIGLKNTGWLRKAGVKIQNTQCPMSVANRPFVRKFLHALANIESKFQLTAAGQLQEKWLNSEAMLNLANSRSRSEWKALMDVRLRLYAPEDYLDIIQTYFRTQGGFAADDDKPSIAVQINASSLNKKDIAAAANISPSALSEFLAGRRAWPQQVRRDIESILERAG
ncbi:hypothetical protein [Calycomorphotria hydatis]|uniref:Uncharacterized protein n=1 Tax=Calycomorphotria hydatis TaxID=2528027 RepID=A0A517T8V1_9PLAN|nr:hypothetical protein [Calycomorphotria hydatis]QDT64779.1 hypothetical protein V22_20200 [Calycomorphotria hydatis]